MQFPLPCCISYPLLREWADWAVCTGGTHIYITLDPFTIDHNIIWKTSRSWTQLESNWRRWNCQWNLCTCYTVSGWWAVLRRTRWILWRNRLCRIDRWKAAQSLRYLTCFLWLPWIKNFCKSHETLALSAESGGTESNFRASFKQWYRWGIAFLRIHSVWSPFTGQLQVTDVSSSYRWSQIRCCS